MKYVKQFLTQEPLINHPTNDQCEIFTWSWEAVSSWFNFEPPTEIFQFWFNHHRQQMNFLMISSRGFVSFFSICQHKNNIQIRKITLIELYIKFHTVRNKFTLQLFHLWSSNGFCSFVNVSIATGKYGIQYLNIFDCKIWGLDQVHLFSETSVKKENIVYLERKKQFIHFYMNELQKNKIVYWMSIAAGIASFYRFYQFQFRVQSSQCSYSFIH